MATDYSKLVKAPKPEWINTGLSAAKPATLLHIYGTPGPLGTDCSPITSHSLKPFIVTRDVGPFKLTGHSAYLDLVTKMFAEVKQHDEELFNQIKTAGSLCCRSVRGVHGTPSSHSFGTAGDYYFGQRNDVVGDGKCQLGLLTLYPYAREQGLYWGCEFGKYDPRREDSMHYEMAEETVKKLLHV